MANANPPFMKTEWVEQEGFLPAITIHPPWSWMIVHGIKDLENRDWTTSYRGPLLIHVGKNVDTTFFDPWGNLYPDVSLTLQTYAHEKGVVAPQHRDDFARGIVGIVTLVDVVTRSTSPWFFGRYGFIFEHARPITSTGLVRGYPGLFPVAVSLLPEGVV